MQAIRPAAAGHQASGEFIDDDDFIVVHHILLILEVQRMSPQCRVQVVYQRDIGGVIQGRAFRQQAHAGQYLFGFFVAGFRQQHLMRFFILGVITGHFNLAFAVRCFFANLHGQQRRYRIDLVIELGVILRLTGNDQWRACLVDQDRVDFIDDRKIQSALDSIPCFIDHVVAQVVKAEFVVGAIRDIGGVSRLLFVMLHLRQIDAGGQSQPAVQLAHPVSIALRQVIIDGDDMHALPRQGIQVDSERRHERLAFTGAHFSDLAVVQHHTANQLDVEVAHFQHTPAGFATHSEYFRQNIVQRRAVSDARLEFRGLRLQFGLG